MTEDPFDESSKEELGKVISFKPKGIIYSSTVSNSEYVPVADQDFGFVKRSRMNWGRKRNYRRGIYLDNHFRY